MALKNLEWNYPGSTTLLTRTAGGHMPSLINESGPGKGDGHNTRVSQANAMADALVDLRAEIGTTTSPSPDSLRAKIDAVTSNAMPVMPRIGRMRPSTFAVGKYTTLDIYALQGFGGYPVAVPFQDGIHRTWSGELEISLGTTGDLGLDTGSIAKAWYYAYLTPDAGDDTICSARISLADPETGPAGVGGKFFYIGPCYNLDGTANLRRWRQIESGHFVFVEPFTATAIDALTKNALLDPGNTYSIADIAPATGVAVDVHIEIEHKNGAGERFTLDVWPGSSGDLSTTSPSFSSPRGLLRATASISDRVRDNAAGLISLDENRDIDIRVYRDGGSSTPQTWGVFFTGFYDAKLT